MDILQLAKDAEEEIIEIRRTIHRNPELSDHEHETASLVAEKLQEMGIEVHKVVEGTGVIGLLRGKNPGKTIGLRADMDALPLKEESGLPFASDNENVMHACGHDMHTSILIGTAKILSSLRDHIQGNVKFIFQPAEEKGKGALSMIEAGAMEDPKVDRMLCLHCWPDLEAGHLGIRKGAMCASADAIEIDIEGVGGHAAHPDKSIDPIPIAANVISTLQTIISRELPPTESAVVTIGKIEGGTAGNVIAPNVHMKGTVRTINPDVRKVIPESLERIVKEIAEGMKGKGMIHYRFGPPPLLNDEEFVELGEQALIEAFGPERVHELKEPSLGSEDFAYYLEKVPGMLFRLGTRDENSKSALPLHHPQVVFSEKAIVPGIVALTTIALNNVGRDEME